MSSLHKNTGKSRRPFMTAVVILLMVIVAAGPAIGQGNSSARSVAMGAAAISLAKGVDAARFNPANLGFGEFQLKGVELAGVGANISNNSFTLGDYNKYTGAFLTDEDKEDILSKISSEGLRLNVDAEASALSVSLGALVFGVTGNGIADINLNRDLIELVLEGNTFGDTIEITGCYSEAVAYASGHVSYGHSIYKMGSRELSIGVTAKYLHGLAIEQVTELEGLAATFTSGFTGEGRLVAQTATGGSGYALDVGAALKLNDNYVVGAKVRNVMSSLTWNKETEEHGFTFSFDTMTVDNMDDDYVVSEDYSIEIDDFSTNLPSVLNVGVAKVSGSLLWALDWEQGFERSTGVSSKPRLSMGVEWSPVAALPLRAGYAVGGNRNSAFSFGSGFQLAYFYMDYAMVTGTTFSGYSSKGLNIAVTTGLYF